MLTQPAPTPARARPRWSVTGNAEYVVYGGEFPTVNGIAQQGLVRFAVKTIAPNKVGPDLSRCRVQPDVTSLADRHAPRDRLARRTGTATTST